MRHFRDIKVNGFSKQFIKSIKSIYYKNNLFIYQDNYLMKVHLMGL